MVMDPVAVSSLIIDGLGVVGSIVRLTLEVKHFKKDCEQVMNDCVLVLEMIRHAGDAEVDKSAAARIKNSLHSCRSFIAQCAQDWGLFHAAFEILFRRKHIEVKKELEWCTQLLIADSVVSLLRCLSFQN
jgi:hypothetical protein